MASTVFDSSLFRDMFGTAEMRAVFEDSAYIKACIDAETALARAQAIVGIIPQDAADKITKLCSYDKLDIDKLRAETEIVGYPILSLVKQMSEQCGDAGGFVHWGATTQDIMDTATMLQCKKGIELVEILLTKTRQALKKLAVEHADTVTAGRTHLQHALPVTFGFRCAVWLSSLNRHAERLEQLKPRALMVEFGGAAGTLASLGKGTEGLRVRAEFAKQLGLANPAITWHVARDGLAEIMTTLAAIGGSLGKIGWDVMMMCASEFGETAEPFVPGRGASSTMPQKRNPISSELMFAAAKLLRERAASMLDALMHDFERATGPWHVEWCAIPESFMLVASSLNQASFMLEGLTVDKARMRRNLDLTGGLIVAEAVMMGMAPVIGRQHAHDVVYEACKEAIENGETLLAVLLRKKGIVDALGQPKLEELTDPANYLGVAATMARQVAESTNV